MLPGVQHARHFSPMLLHLKLLAFLQGFLFYFSNVILHIVLEMDLLISWNAYFMYEYISKGMLKIIL